MTFKSPFKYSTFETDLQFLREVVGDYRLLAQLPEATIDIWRLTVDTSGPIVRPDLQPCHCASLFWNDIAVYNIIDL